MLQQPTAAVLIIGNEILSGRTQDVNVQFIAERLTLRGIRLTEVRVVRDEETAIIKAVRELSQANDSVFSTGGIGPTHDDITTACVAKAFGVAVEINVEAKLRMEEYFKGRGVEMTEGRLRMARIPVGAALIDNAVSVMPGFRLNNVYVMAGVPKIMQGMFLSVENTLAQGTPLFSNTVSCTLREGDIAIELEKIQKQYPGVEIGSYPTADSLSLVLRAPDEGPLDEATRQVVSLLEKRGEQHPVVTYQRPPNKTTGPATPERR